MTATPPPDTVHCYEVEDTWPGILLCVGRPVGRTRPALFLRDALGQEFVLAQFQGPEAARTARAFLDEMTDAITRAIAHHYDGDQGK